MPKQKVLTINQPKGIESQRTTQTSVYQPKVAQTSASAEDYIAKYKDIAVSEMNQYGIPASVKLAQALLESGNGNSYLARQANNHFGIKCASGWSGERILKDDDEIDDCFRVYDQPEQSYRDHSEFLLRKRYSALFELDKNDYKGWARGLKSAGYATNPRYADLLVSIIERYQLFQYDLPESNRDKIEREEKVFSEIVENVSNDSIDAIVKPPVSMVIHEVKKGETLYAIANQYGLTVEEFKKLNDIETERIIPGQLFLVSN